MLETDVLARFSPKYSLIQSLICSWFIWECGPRKQWCRKKKWNSRETGTRMSCQAVSPTALSKAGCCFNSLQPCGEHYGVHFTAVCPQDKTEYPSHQLLSCIDEEWLSGRRHPFYFWIMQRRIPRSWEREPQCWPCQRLLKWYRRGLQPSRKTPKECIYNQ